MGLIKRYIAFFHPLDRVQAMAQLKGRVEVIAAYPDLEVPRGSIRYMMPYGIEREIMRPEAAPSAHTP